MSVEAHRANSPTGPVRFAILVVSSTRTLAEDRSGRRIAELLQAAGHEVVGRVAVPDDPAAIRQAVQGASEAQVVISTGGTGLAPSDQTPEAVRPLLARSIEGFGELFRLLSFEAVGSAAMLSRATAGVLADGRVLFALPGSVAACELAVQRLILPEVGHLLSLVGPIPQVPAVASDPEVVEEAEWELVDDEISDEDAETEEAPRFEPGPELYQLGSEERPADPDEGVLGPWMRALVELGGEIVKGEREPVPQAIEKLAPVLNVLESAGEVAVLKGPGRARYSLWGWPDLRRPQSKVLAVGWGDPLAEVWALHRFPTPTGTCVEGGGGYLPAAEESVAEVCTRITGRAPEDDSGQLFAVSGDTVWILRGRRVIRWDGRRERDDGNAKQALATLLMDWHAR